MRIRRVYAGEKVWKDICKSIQKTQTPIVHYTKSKMTPPGNDRDHVYKITINEYITNIYSFMHTHARIMHEKSKTAILIEKKYK